MSETTTRSYETLEVELKEGILTVALHRPDRMNAFNMTMADELVRVMDYADATDEVRCVILTGKGKAFCAGADLEAGGETFDAERGDLTLSEQAPPAGGHRDPGGIVTLRFFQSKKPLIAAINGHAVGIGITMTLPCDVRLVAENAKIGFVFTQRGIVPEACSTWFLPRLVGISKALDWTLSGRVFPAQEGHESGLFSQIVTADELQETARQIARTFADATSAVSVALTRQSMWRGLTVSHPMEAHRVESRGMFYMGAREDAREGVESFLEKRPAEFSMKVSQDLPDGFPWWQDPDFSE